MPLQKDSHADNKMLQQSTETQQTEEIDSYATGSIHSSHATFRKNDPNHSSNAISIEDFKILKVIGRGSFGKVYQVQKRDDQRIFAMKTLKKDMVLRKNQMTNTQVERMILERLDHPFIVKLHFAF